MNSKVGLVVYTPGPGMNTLKDMNIIDTKKQQCEKYKQSTM